MVVRESTHAQWLLILSGPWVLWPRVDKLIASHPSAADDFLRLLEAVPKHAPARVQLSVLSFRVQRHALLVLLRYSQWFDRRRVEELLRDYGLDQVEQYGANKQKHSSSIAMESTGHFTDGMQVTMPCIEGTVCVSVAPKTNMTKQEASTHDADEWFDPSSQQPCSRAPQVQYAQPFTPVTQSDERDIPLAVSFDADDFENESCSDRQADADRQVRFSAPLWEASRCEVCRQSLDPFKSLHHADPYLAALWFRCWSRFREHPPLDQVTRPTETSSSSESLSIEASSVAVSHHNIQHASGRDTLSTEISGENRARSSTSSILQREEAQLVLEWSRRMHDDAASAGTPPLALLNVRTAQDWQALCSVSTSPVESLYCLYAVMQLPEQASARAIESGIASILRPMVECLDAPASRLVLSVVRLSQRLYPRALLEQLVYPLLTRPFAMQGEAAPARTPLSPYQAELCLQIFDSDLETAFLVEALKCILERGFAAPWNERTLLLLECLLKRLAPTLLDPWTANLLVQALEANVNAPTLQNAGLRVAKLFHLLLIRYPAVVAAHCPTLIAILQRAPENFLRDSALRKLQTQTQSRT
ncbi:hypothetical protein CCYA_CCYA05G1527 [Cyanidiococcus yangmingshanensis]|nr:hypothetical protein CCYA_CCYA05G1527 [Cyanidiococcus yangmingshanensis]